MQSDHSIPPPLPEIIYFHYEQYKPFLQPDSKQNESFSLKRQVLNRIIDLYFKQSISIQGIGKILDIDEIHAEIAIQIEKKKIRKMGPVSRDEQIYRTQQRRKKREESLRIYLEEHPERQFKKSKKPRRKMELRRRIDPRKRIEPTLELSRDPRVIALQASQRQSRLQSRTQRLQELYPESQPQVQQNHPPQIIQPPLPTYVHYPQSYSMMYPQQMVPQMIPQMVYHPIIPNQPFNYLYPPTQLYYPPSFTYPPQNP